MKSKIKNNFYRLQVQFTKLNQLYIYKTGCWQNFQNLRNTRGVILVEYLRNNRQEILLFPRVRRDYRRRETTVIQGARIAIEDLLLIIVSNS